MSVTREDIRGIANLARLSLTPEEEIRYAEQLSAVLSYVDRLNEVDTENVKPTVQVGGLSDVTRDDVALASSSDTQKNIQALFPRVENRMLSVPAVFEDQSE
jgi:aspartyl-tRNA(Asn)/glutamyl-tRNA(Gln) amidotransferase subunit C